MAKRFGRQQKRKMRAEIQRLKSSHEETQSSLGVIRDQFGQLLEVISNLNPHSVALKEAEVDPGTWRLSVAPYLVPYCMQNDRPQVLNVLALDLYELSAELEKSGEFMDSVHARVCVRDQFQNVIRWDYRASIPAFKGMGVDRIAKDIARNLHKELREKF